MERLILRSFSLAQLEAELRHQEFLAEARRHTLAREARGPRSGFRLPLPGFLIRDRTRG
jgi:hypothetical protein